MDDTELEQDYGQAALRGPPVQGHPVQGHGSVNNQEPVRVDPISNQLESVLAEFSQQGAPGDDSRAVEAGRVSARAEDARTAAYGIRVPEGVSTFATGLSRMMSSSTGGNGLSATSVAVETPSANAGTDAFLNSRSLAAMVAPNSEPAGGGSSLPVDQGQALAVNRVSGVERQNQPLGFEPRLSQPIDPLGSSAQVAEMPICTEILRYCHPTIAAVREGW